MNSKTHRLILTALFAALTAVGAFIRIPLGIMSFTLQFFFAAMAGVLLGPRYGAASQGTYVALGLVGLPVFTLGGGLGYLLQPSFGFLLGLIPATAVIGRLTEKGKGPAWTALACAAGLGVLYLVGLPYMHGIVNLYLGKGMPVWKLIRDGMLVYLPGDLLKIVLLVPLVQTLQKRLGTHGPA